MSLRLSLFPAIALVLLLAPGVSGCTSTPTDALSTAAAPGPPRQQATLPPVGDPAPIGAASPDAPTTDPQTPSAAIAGGVPDTPEPSTATTYVADEAVRKPSRSGQYPRFGRARAQTEQFTAEQADRMRAEMNAVSKDRKPKDTDAAQAQYRKEIAAMKKLLKSQQQKREIQSTY